MQYLSKPVTGYVHNGSLRKGKRFGGKVSIEKFYRPEVLSEFVTSLHSEKLIYKGKIVPSF